LKNFKWDYNGTCTKCNSNGITIDIPLCDHHLKQRPSFSSDDSSEDSSEDSNEDSNEDYDCFLCDYEGERHYDGDEKINKFEFCDECWSSLLNCCAKRIRGEPQTWEGNGWIGICSRCNQNGGVEVLYICKYHIELTK
jgi:hypothetical protein